MLGYVTIVLIYIFLKFNILFQSKERHTQTKLLPAKLRAVLATFGFLENLFFVDSAQC